MVPEAHRLTYDDYLRMPNDGHRYEIIEGELLVSAAPSLAHQRVSRNLEVLLVQHVRSRRLGEVYHAPCTVRLTPNEPVEPDIFFVSQRRRHILGGDAVHGPPDLIVEIISPSTASWDRGTKFNRYAQVGVVEYWLVDPLMETVEQYILQEGQYVPLAPHEDGTLGSSVIADLRLEPAEIFAQ